MRAPMPRIGTIGMSTLAAVGLAWCLGTAPSLGAEPRSGPKNAGTGHSVPSASSRAKSLGEELFLRNWEVNDPRGHGGDGLGPVFNERSCVACHGLGGAGGGGRVSKNVDLLAANPARFRPAQAGETLPALDRSPLANIHPGLVTSGSIVLHRFGTTPTYAGWRKTKVAGENGRTGARSIGFGDGTFNLVLSHRNASALFGSGEIDGIDATAIEREAERQAWYSPDVKGRVARQKDGRVGRFGWKAQVPTLRDFVLNACAVELGLETPTHHQTADPFGFGAKPLGLDMSADDCDALIAFVHDLPEPIARHPENHEKGRALFNEIGCVDCHKPNLGGVDGIYSDLLLHEMGNALSDSGAYYGEDDGESSPGAPKPGEWRTPPLWGVADSAPYLHDGRAKTLTEAIRAHDGQANASRTKFGSLPKGEQKQVIGFLMSLTAKSSTRVVPTKSRKSLDVDPAEERALRQLQFELSRPKAAGASTGLL